MMMMMMMMMVMIIIIMMNMNDGIRLFKTWIHYSNTAMYDTTIHCGGW